VILVDSSVWIDFFRAKASPQTRRLDELLGSSPLAIGDLMLVEVLQGVSHDHEFQRTRKLFEALHVVELCGQELAVKAARNYRVLRSRGVTARSTIDTIIASRCIADDISLLYSDRDFDPFVKYLGLRPALLEVAG
jgi:predicted nucleic acid-binding protein